VIYTQIVLGEKTFVAPSTKARMVRKAIEITEKVNFSDLKTADLDNLVGYVVELFGKEFTLDDVYDGLDAEQLIPTLLDCINSVVGKMGAKLTQLPKNLEAGS
jgi:hypothetical protein